MQLPDGLQFPAVLIVADAWLAVGGLTLRLCVDDAQLTSAADPVLQPFTVAAGPAATADIEISAGWTTTPLRVCGTQRFAGGNAWLLHEDGDGYVITCCTEDGRPYKQAHFTRDFSRGTIAVAREPFAERLAAGGTIDPLEYPLDEVLMIHALANGRGLAVHACGVLDGRGRAFVFAGQSGAGKSTMARLLAGTPGLTLLSDERLVIRTDGPVPMVYGTPWHGDALFVSPACGPLAGCYLLRQAPAHAVVPLAAPVAAARLLSCAFLAFHDRVAVSQAVTMADLIVSRAPAGELRFARDAAVRDVLPLAPHS